MHKKLIISITLIIALGGVGVLAFQQLAPGKEAGEAKQQRPENGSGKPKIPKKEHTVLQESSQQSRTDERDVSRANRSQSQTSTEAYISSTSDLYVVKGGSQSKVLSNSETEESIGDFASLSPGKDRIAFTLRLNTVLAMFDLSTSEITKLYNASHHTEIVESPTWSPDGRHLAITIGSPANSGISIINTNTGEEELYIPDSSQKIASTSSTLSYLSNPEWVDETTLSFDVEISSTVEEYSELAGRYKIKIDGSGLEKVYD